ncbi:MAG: hypothetical protein AAGF57_19930 [Pseudomonadota bacterium]
MKKPIQLDQHEVEVLDMLIDGDWPLPHLIKGLQGFSDEAAKVSVICNLYHHGLIEFFERASLFSLDDIEMVRSSLERGELLTRLTENIDNPLFGVDLTDLGKQLITEFNSRSK